MDIRTFPQPQCSWGRRYVQGMSTCRWFDGFDDERSLGLHRIRNAGASTLTFKRPVKFELRKYDDDRQFGFGEGQRLQLRFRIKKDADLHLTESPLSRDQQCVETDDGWLEITATVVDSAMLDWWLRWFGDAVTALRKMPLTTKKRSFDELPT